jgi:hypothetical protein
LVLHSVVVRKISVREDRQELRNQPISASSTLYLGWCTWSSNNTQDITMLSLVTLIELCVYSKFIY